MVSIIVKHMLYPCFLTVTQHSTIYRVSTALYILFLESLTASYEAAGKTWQPLQTLNLP